MNICFWIWFIIYKKYWIINFFSLLYKNQKKNVINFKFKIFKKFFVVKYKLYYFIKDIKQNKDNLVK